MYLAIQMPQPADPLTCSHVLVEPFELDNVLLLSMSVQDWWALTTGVALAWVVGYGFRIVIQTLRHTDNADN